MEKKTLIAYTNYDIIFRNMTEQFKDKALDFYGIECAPIVRVEPTDLPTITVNDRRMDFLFLLADNTYLHLEFQTAFQEKDLDRFLQYDVSAYQLYQKPIRTVVVYGADVSQATTRKTYGSIDYKTQAVYMKQYDGDKIMQDLWNKVENGQELSEIDELNLIFLPLMHSSVDRSERVIQTVDLAKKISDEEKKIHLMATIIAISDKFIDKKYVDKLMEVLRMARVLQEFAKRERLSEAISTKKEMIQDYLEVRLGLEAKTVQHKIEQINNLELLSSLAHNLYRAANYPEIIELIDDTLEKQQELEKNPQ